MISPICYTAQEQAAVHGTIFSKRNMYTVAEWAGHSGGLMNILDEKARAWDLILEVDLPEQAKQFLDFLADKIRKEIELVNAIDVADIGCGRGELVCSLARELPNCRFVGYDQSHSIVSRLSLNALPNVEFRCLSLPQVPDEPFDCVLCTNTLHYIRESMLSIKRLWTIVRPGGLLILNYPNRYYVSLLPSTPQSEQWGIVEEPMRNKLNLLTQKQIRKALPRSKQRRLHKSGSSNIYLTFEKAA